MSNQYLDFGANVRCHITLQFQIFQLQRQQKGEKRLSLLLQP